jgi:hypothetical protein
MRHLDDLLYQQLLTSPGQVPAEVREHLQHDCEQCADYLARLPAADALDGRVDLALLGAASRASRSDLAPSGEIEAILARVERSAHRIRPGPWLAALAALVLAGVGLSVAYHPRSLESDGLKGASALTVATSFALVGSDGRASSAPLDGRVTTDGTLSIRLDLSRAARVSVLRLGAHDSEVLLLNEPFPAGPSDLRRGGQLVGVPLSGLSDQEQFRVVASERDLTPVEAEAAARGQPVDGAAAGGFSIQVGP